MKKAAQSILAALLLLAAAGCSSVPDATDTTILDCNTDKYPEPEDRELFYAAVSGNLEAAKKAMDDGANLNVSDKLDQSALMWACWKGHEDIIREMSRFDDEKIKKRSKKHRPLQYAAESAEKYNALFCLIMSNSMPTERSLGLQKLLISKSPGLLTCEDSYKETALHKAARSGSVEYLDFHLKRLKKEGTLPAALEKRNVYGETPLIVAIRARDAAMVRQLVRKGADVTAKDVDGNNAAVIALDGGGGDIAVFMELMKGWLSNGIQQDADLEKAFVAISEKYEGDPIQEFRILYQDVRDGEVRTPASLAKLWEMKRKLLEIASRKSVSAEDIEKARKILRDAPGVLRARFEDEYEAKQKSALQLCIENNGNEELFSLLLRSMPPQVVVQVSGGTGDYLICAILCRRPAIIEKLLDDAKEGHTPEWLMADCHSFSTDESTDKRTCNPVAQFVMIPELWQDGRVALLRKILSYYAEQFGNSHYAMQVLDAATGLRKRNIDPKIPILEMYKYAGFKRVRPIHFVLLETDCIDELRQQIEGGLFDGESGKSQYLKKDRNRKDFQSLLDERKDEPQIQAIIDLLKAKGLYVPPPSPEDKEDAK